MADRLMVNKMSKMETVSQQALHYDLDEILNRISEKQITTTVK